MECILIPVVIVAIIIAVLLISDLNDGIKYNEKQIKYIEKLNLNETLSQQIRTYIKTSRISSDYYNIGDLSKYIHHNKSKPPVDKYCEDLKKNDYVL